MMILVSGTTRTIRDLVPSHSGRLGCLVTPKNRSRTKNLAESGLPWAIDNGAFAGFNETAFMKLIKRAEGLPGLLWVACPDVLYDAKKTLETFSLWVGALRRLKLPVALVAQDGLDDLVVPWDEFDCLFLGGSTEFKLSDAAFGLCREAKARGKTIHMGRVNSLRRMRRAKLFNCDTIDGSSASMFGDTHLKKYLHWLKWLDEQSVMPLFQQP